MVDSVNMIHEEMMAPDIRYALLVIVTVIFILAWLWHFKRHTPTGEVSVASEASARTLVALGFGFAADWIVWLSGSGNSRYFLPMASVASVVSLALLFRLMINHSKGRNYILLALLAAQLTQLYLGTEYRWNATAWDGRWFNITVPERLTKESNLYLSIGMQSNSFIVPFLAKNSGFIDFAGGYALGPDGANAARVKSLIGRNAPNLRVLISGEKIYADDALREPRQSQVDDSLGTFGLRVDMSDCETITIHGLQPALQITLESSVPAPEVSPEARNTSYLVSCHVVADNRDHLAEVSVRQTADLVLNRLEDACPALFQPRRPQTEHGGRAWIRRYVNTDLTAWISKGDVKFIQPIRGGKLIVVGREDDWAKAPPTLRCGRRDGVYFASVLDSGNDY